MEEFETIAELLSTRARQYPDRTLLIFSGTSLSYAETEAGANRVANWLLSNGVQKGQVVASFMSNSIEHALVWLGCAKVGAIFAAINTSLKRNDLAYTLADLEAPLVFVEPNLVATLNEGALLAGTSAPKSCVIANAREDDSEPAVTFTREVRRWADLVASPAQHVLVPQRSGDPIGILYTGGSTGMPKGVLLPNGWYIAGAVRFSEFLEPEAGSVHFGLGQLFHANGTAIDILGPLYRGISAVISGGFSASQFWQQIRATNASTALMVGPMITILVNAPSREDDAQVPLKRIIGGTAQIAREIRDEFERRFAVEIIECYAQTESGPLTVGERPHDKPYLSNGTGRGWTDLQIVDDDGRPLAANQLGEICVRPRQPNTCMLGYHKKPEMTVKAWKDLWFHSGDLGYLDEHGRLHFKSRKAHSIRKGGENISAFEVEQVLALHEAVADVAVVGVPSSIGEEDVKAYIQLKDGSGTVAESEFIVHCAARIARFKVPRYIEYVTGFPRSATKQEIERHVLRDRGIGAAWDREADAASRKAARAS